MLQLFQKFVKSTKSLWFYFTRKGRKNCVDYVPANVQTEINFYQNRLRDHPQVASALTQHAWSRDFQCWLLRNNNLTLLNQVASDEELEILIVEKGYHYDFVVEALKRHTPSSKLLEKLDYQKEYIQGLVKRIPAAFCKAPIEKIAENKDILEFFIDWAIGARNLWALLTDYLVYIVENKLPYDEVVYKLVSNLICGAEISHLVPLLKKHYPMSYAKVRESIWRYNNSRDIIREAFIPKNLPSGADIKDINDIRTSGVLNDEDDALAWLKITSCDVGDCFYLYEILLSALDDIKRVNAKIFEQVCFKMSDNRNVDTAFIRKATNEAIKKAINKRPSCLDLKKLYPFADWPEDLQKQALDIIIDHQRLSFNDLNKLSDAMRTYVNERLEIKAQIQVAQFGSYDDMCDLCGTKRYAEVEVYIAKASNSNARVNASVDEILQISMTAKRYMLTHDVSPEAFREYLEVNNERCVREYMEYKGGLTKAEYEVLLLSRYRYLALKTKVLSEK